MSDASPETTPTESPQRRWRPLNAIDRRVVGVLAEKAKTTPDIYPMSLNAVCTGSNQKSNRSPLMQLEPERVEESLDRLREAGAVGLVEGYGRVQKYRHYLYEWLGVDKVELAIMTELLLRGDQTVGELRARASRMEPIRDLAALRPILESLTAKGLVVALSPEGRGQTVSHALYPPAEFEVLRSKHQASSSEATANRPCARAPAPVETPMPELDALHSEVAQLRNDLDALREAHEDLAEQFRQFQEALGG